MFFAIWSNCASASAIHFCKAIKFSPMLLSSTTVRLLKTKSAVRAPPPLVEVPPQLKLKAVGPTLVFLFFFLLPMTVTVQVVFFYFFLFPSAAVTPGY